MNAARSLWRKVEKSVAHRGVLRTLRFGAAAAARKVRDLSPARRRALAAAHEAHQEFDREFGVDTGGLISLSDLEVQSENWKLGHRYQPIYQVDFAEILHDLNPRYEDYTFVDIGSGKGRALLLAAKLPFRRIIGVEFSRELHETAERNIRIYPDDRKACRSIESICMDALEYPLPDGPLVLYLYNPFERPLMEKLAASVKQSLKSQPRPLVILYFNPENADLWRDGDAFQVVREHSGYHLFRSANAG